MKTLRGMQGQVKLHASREPTEIDTGSPAACYSMKRLVGGGGGGGVWGSRHNLRHVPGLKACNLVDGSHRHSISKQNLGEGSCLLEEVKWCRGCNSHSLWVRMMIHSYGTTHSEPSQSRVGIDNISGPDGQRPVRRLGKLLGGGVGLETDISCLAELSFTPCVTRMECRKLSMGPLSPPKERGKGGWGASSMLQVGVVQNIPDRWTGWSGNE